MKPGLAFKKQRISCPLFAFKFHPLSLTRPMCEPHGEKDVPSVRFSRCWILLVHAWVSPCFPEPRTRKTHPALSSIANPSYIEKRGNWRLPETTVDEGWFPANCWTIVNASSLNRPWTGQHVTFAFQSQPSILKDTVSSPNLLSYKQTVEGPKERETFQASVVPTCCLYVANPRSEKVLQLFSSIQTRS